MASKLETIRKATGCLAYAELFAVVACGCAFVTRSVGGVLEQVWLGSPDDAETMNNGVMRRPQAQPVIPSGNLKDRDSD